MGFFSEIPRHNQLDILKKLNFKDFTKFKQCSQETVEVTTNFKHPLFLVVSRMNFEENSFTLKLNSTKAHNLESIFDEPIRFITGNLSVKSSHSKGISLEEFFNNMKNRMLVQSLYIRVENGDPATLNNLIKHFKVKNLRIMDYNSALLPDLKMVNELKFYTAEMRESDFLLLETKNIWILQGGVTLSSVNKFLKQWIEGKRRIDKLQIEPLPRDHLEMFEGLEYTILYAPGMKKFMGMDDGDCTILNVYSIARDNGKKLFISVDYWEDDINGQMQITGGEDYKDDVKMFIYSTYASENCY